MGSIKSGRLEDPTDGSDLSDVETTLRSLGIELRSSNALGSPALMTCYEIYCVLCPHKVEALMNPYHPL